MRLVEIAEIGAGVLRVGVLVPQRRGMAKLNVGIFFRQVEHERFVIAERRRQDKAGPVEVDHRFHRLGDRVGLGHVLFLRHLHARHQLQGFDCNRMRLIQPKSSRAPT